MPDKDQRIAIISFDGLSAQQFERLLAQLPVLDSVLKDGNLTMLDASPFSDAKPIWAEILTGRHWYRNGCAGYAMPLRSLNELRIFSESDLLVKESLLPPIATDQCNIVINIPLLEPRGDERRWMGDGGSPTLTTVDPAYLLQSEPFKSSTPRPIISMGAAMADVSAITTFIATELNRLECALALCSDANWKSILYRANIFDQLAHLLGPSFLDESRLKVSAQLKDLFAKLDSGLSEIISSADNYLFISAYSHTACKEMFSLNDFFQSLRLLKRVEDRSPSTNLRKQAFALVKNVNPISSTALVSEATQFSTSETICASPIRGTVYMNSIIRFVDGIIDNENLQSQEERIEDVLATELRTFSGTDCLFRNPVVESNLRAPSFIVNLAGVDLVDSLSTVRRHHELPHSVHDSHGFIFSKERPRTTVKSVEVVDIITNM